ncbi:MAG: AAA family ATPase [Polyangiaceae bacterium]|nr:AAA family ATPase [Polyangiaceae bacterium]
MSENDENTKLTHHIDQIHIEGFKSIEKATVPLGPLNVLIGENGAGKSNFISAFRLLHAMTDPPLNTYVTMNGGVHSVLRFGPEVTRRMSVKAEIKIDGVKSVCQGTVACTGGGQYYSAEIAQACPAATAPKPESTGGREIAQTEDERPQPNWKASIRGELESFLNRIKVYHFNDTSGLSALKSSCDSHAYRFLYPDGANLAAFLYMLREAHPSHYDRITSAIQRVFPSFGGFDIEPDRHIPGKVSLEWFENDHEPILTACDISDGTLRFICLAALLMQPFDHPQAPEVIVIDEPELGLHPFAVAQIAAMLEAASRYVQVIVSTQSSILVRRLTSPDSVMIVNRSLHGTVFERLEPADLALWLDDYEHIPMVFDG